MARTCTICAHPERAAIDRALVAGEANRGIARRFSASDDAVQRHKADHLPQRLAAAKGAEDAAAADDLLAQVRALQAHALDILAATKDAAEPDYRTALAAIREARGCVELFAKIREAEEIEQRVAAIEEHLAATAQAGQRPRGGRR
jgi:hypothetical protein